MSGLDMNYIADLIIQAQDNDSNAFAEFYAATFQQQYTFAMGFLKNEFQAQEVLQKSYTQALSMLARIRDPMMIISWLTRITLRCCMDVKGITGSFAVSVGSKRYSVARMMNLPMTESLTLLLRYVCNMDDRKISKVLEIRRKEVHTYHQQALKRLDGLESGGERRI